MYISTEYLNLCLFHKREVFFQYILLRLWPARLMSAFDNLLALVGTNHNGGKILLL